MPTEVRTNFLINLLLDAFFVNYNDGEDIEHNLYHFPSNSFSYIKDAFSHYKTGSTNDNFPSDKFRLNEWETFFSELPAEIDDVINNYQRNAKKEYFKSVKEWCDRIESFERVSPQKLNRALKNLITEEKTRYIEKDIPPYFGPGASLAQMNGKSIESQKETITLSDAEVEKFFNLYNELIDALRREFLRIASNGIRKYKNDDKEFHQIFESMPKYHYIMDLLVSKGLCTPITYFWVDKKKKSLLVQIIKQLHKLGYYKDNIMPTSKVIKSIALNTFGSEISIDLIKHADIELKRVNFIEQASSIIG